MNGDDLGINTLSCSIKNIKLLFLNWIQSHIEEKTRIEQRGALQRYPSKFNQRTLVSLPFSSKSADCFFLITIDNSPKRETRWLWKAQAHRQKHMACFISKTYKYQAFSPSDFLRVTLFFLSYLPFLLWCCCVSSSLSCCSGARTPYLMVYWCDDNCWVSPVHGWTLPVGGHWHGGDWRKWDGGHGSQASAKECVATHLPNDPRLVSDLSGSSIDSQAGQI